MEYKTPPEETAKTDVVLSEVQSFGISSEGNGILLHSYSDKEGKSEQVIYIGSDSMAKADLILREHPKRVVLLSTTYVAYMESLGILDRICGVSNADLIYSPEIKQMIKDGRITDVGNDVSLDTERILGLQPDLVLCYDFGPSTAALINRLEKMGLKVIRINEFREVSPLGKAEWIKFFAHLFGLPEKGDDIYADVEESYNDLLKQSQSIESEPPTVFTGLPWKGQWYQPGGKSFQARLFQDAGGNYLWSDNNDVSGITVDREAVFAKALDADIWLHPSNALNLEEISDMDARYKEFKSFQKGRVYNCNLRLNEHMGNDYWESGIMNPHLVLADLLAIFHPESYPDHNFTYYRKLE